MIPNKLYLSHSPIPVKLVKNPTESGSYASPERYIEIDESLSEVNRLITLIHEVIHDIFLTTGMNADDNATLKHLTEEQICSALSNGLTELLLRNPGLVDYVKEIYEKLPN